MQPSIAPIIPTTPNSTHEVPPSGSSDIGGDEFAPTLAQEVSKHSTNTDKRSNTDSDAGEPTEGDSAVNAQDATVKETSSPVENQKFDTNLDPAKSIESISKSTNPTTSVSSEIKGNSLILDDAEFLSKNLINRTLNKVIESEFISNVASKQQLVASEFTSKVALKQQSVNDTLSGLLPGEKGKQHLTVNSMTNALVNGQQKTDFTDKSTAADLLKSLNPNIENKSATSAETGIHQKSPNPYLGQTSLYSTQQKSNFVGITVPGKVTLSTHDTTLQSNDPSVKSIDIVNIKDQALPRSLNGVTVLERISDQKLTQNTAEPVTTENVIAKLTVAPFEEITPSVLKERSPTPLRQDIGSQYLTAKVNDNQPELQAKSDNQSFEQKNDNQPQSKLLSTSSGNILSSSSESSTLTPFSSFMSESSLQATTIDTARPMYASLSNQVYENDVVNQVVKKFQNSQIQNDTKLVLKLHPAELGELKIDIQLKGGVINASILAQNRQVQDILEKNLPKLKELMEQQGLNVDDISVSFESDVLADFKQFEEQMQKDSSQSKSKNSGSSIQFSLDPAAIENDEISEIAEGVNLKV